MIETDPKILDPIKTDGILEATYPTWKCMPFGDKSVSIYPENVPNRFYRFMQRVLLGFRWEKR